MVLQTLLVLLTADRVGSDTLLASPQRVEVLDEIEQGIERGHMTIRPEICTVTLVDVARHIDTWQIFVGDNN